MNKERTHVALKATITSAGQPDLRGLKRFHPGFIATGACPKCGKLVTWNGRCTYVMYPDHRQAKPLELTTQCPHCLAEPIALRFRLRVEIDLVTEDDWKPPKNVRTSELLAKMRVLMEELEKLNSEEAA